MKAQDDLAQLAVDAVAKHGTITVAADAVMVPRKTLSDWYKSGVRQGLKAQKGSQAKDRVGALTTTIRRLESELKHAQKESADAAAIKAIIGKTAEEVSTLELPLWLEARPRSGSHPGVPTLFLSDLHWGERVHASQSGGVNSYGLAIAHERLHSAVETAIHLVSLIDGHEAIPGIVCPLGGDMISGNIHDELSASNELNTMPTVLDLFGHLVRAIERLADVYKHVFVPCVTGNHGRDTRKIWSKDRHHTSFDWLIYQFLAKHFEGDKRIQFYVPDGSDALYKIYEHRYLLTHGDQFRGGDGVIGALGPIIRGDHRKRSRNMQIAMDYDTLLLGHWHQYMHLTRLIVNGSLKGYDEYAYTSNFPFEVPQQALWMTHPKYGITFRMPVRCDRLREPKKTSWVSVAA